MIRPSRIAPVIVALSILVMGAGPARAAATPFTIEIVHVVPDAVVLVPDGGCRTTPRQPLHLTISFAYRGRTYLRTLQFRDACALVGRTRTITTGQWSLSAAPAPWDDLVFLVDARLGARGDVTGVVTFVLASGGRTQRFRARYSVRRRVVTYRLV